ncbi:type I-F CRISPR-associated protein Csy3 [bacterium (Candidatus Blackallbacteria) CG17_big_fil_post_rev_8_21_14_2_50_48_46]|uniref:Type I-F CRISPR-associated protein Csy3 n=1 Tax=bacterium (Candidatus Blackallbacteria) CG17_big_fil_post_rev_8_21_14_2_50_48_46 TaxID=2014261 RepID=A0A2M7G8W2_9BACT|nr:MAG: type I-F CRISPR-associated protein Csy3 [bacterium (Candidatus Blackallbacteria) CG18_big_fil_WC_8_21_14_2_50_49_26]PIW18548.1 MAG: type I-F CRISPR-associated protein Csy3 [bacterium (Candidatus Blackallbacteria) CG17_big_fil_post_rev_8_21_14_2_50_48_46]PIW46467.1 MAG: type I-F CRISPR-associated protein Csy3 [bacterium (Candidatus Blackallbacteria) CG13_big_fil_rev_8_21_14_2_50_49_14]
MAKKEEVASVLAFEKKLVPSDGYLYGTCWEQRNENAMPLSVMEKSVRGTISNRLKKELKSDPAKLDAEVEKPNLQTVDYCALGVEQDTLKLQFTLKILAGAEIPSACNNNEFQKTLTAAGQKYIESEGFSELARRYAVNIANGRFFWRNRVGAEKMEIQVKDVHSPENTWIFDATKFSVQDFDCSNAQIASLAQQIALALSGKRSFLLLEINAYALIGTAQEVYPSEELVMDKGKGKKSKILYSVNNIAGMHSQKIGNALRTIDTWYPENDEMNGRPIAIEPYGAVTNLGRAYRTPKDKADFYTLFDRWARGESLSNKQDEHFVMAVLVRGGVFGESGKE